MDIMHNQFRLATGYSQRRKLRGTAGRGIRHKTLGGGDGTAYIPPKLKTIKNNINSYSVANCSIYYVIRWGSCVVCTVLKLQHYVRNCLFFSFYLFRH